MKRWAALILVAGCTRTEDLKLPEPPEANFGFMALFDQEGRAVEVGEVVSRTRLYSGQYEIRSKERGLESRLYLFTSRSLTDATQNACAGLPDATQRARCRDLARRCESAPELCLAPRSLDDGCGTRAELDPAPETLVFVAEGDKLVPRTDARAAEGLRFCGPELDSGCPSWFPGFVGTRDGAFVCVAPAVQLDCRLDVDLTACGLPSVTGEVGADGSLVLNGCQAEPLAGSPYPEARGYVFRCGEVSLAMSAMESLIGAAECPRQGPGAFSSAFVEGRYDVPGALVGAAAYLGAWYFAGYGLDSCAYQGCLIGGGNCSQSCGTSCRGGAAPTFLIAECLEFPFPECTSEDRYEICLNRCIDYCSKGQNEPCAELARGMAVSWTAPGRPEVDLGRIDLPDATDAVATGIKALHPVSIGGQDGLVLATREYVHVIRLSSNQMPTVVSLRLGYVGHGLEPHPTDPELVLVHGVNGPNTVIGRVRFSLEGPSAILEAQAESEGPALWAAAASASQLFGIDGGSALRAWSLTGGGASPVPLPGAATAIVALPRDTVLVGLQGDNGPALALISPDARVLKTYPLPRGLTVKSMLAEPSSCAVGASGPCRVFLGLQRQGAVGPALVGLFLLDAGVIESSRLLPAMTELNTQAVDWMALDATTLLTGVRLRNLMTPVTLAR